MRRRKFITLSGMAAAYAILPRVAHTQSTPVVGYLNSGSAGSLENLLTAFRRGLSETGYVEGRNVAIEFRWADDHHDRLPALAEELVRRRVNVIMTVGPNAAVAAKAATATIPVVFTYGGDPVQDGLVASFNRPGGNVTGTTFITAALAPKRLELLRELVPKAELIGVLANPTTLLAEIQWRELQTAAGQAGQQLYRVNASSEAELDDAFAALVQKGAKALLVTTDTMFYSRRNRLIALAARHRIPASWTFREYAVAGGLMSYGASITDTNRQGGVYVGRILKGEKPGDLPVMQPTKFELIVNLKAAKALGLAISESFLLRADEVIE
jgi:putative ABC transport system substrate-binding protein